MSWSKLPLEVKYEILVLLPFKKVAFVADDFFWRLYCKKRSIYRPDRRLTWKNTAYRGVWFEEFRPTLPSVLEYRATLFNNLISDYIDTGLVDCLLTEQKIPIPVTIDRGDTIIDRTNSEHRGTNDRDSNEEVRLDTSVNQNSAFRVNGCDRSRPLRNNFITYSRKRSKSFYTNVTGGFSVKRFHHHVFSDKHSSFETYNVYLAPSDALRV